MTFSLVENNKLVHPLILTEVPEEDFVCVCVCMCVCVWGNKDIFIMPFPLPIMQ